MSDAIPTAADRKYAVFISYRHADNKEQGRQWASWLGHLEEGSLSHDLGGQIRDALKRSRFLCNCLPAHRPLPLCE